MDCCQAFLPEVESPCARWSAVSFEDLRFRSRYWRWRSHTSDKGSLLLAPRCVYRQRVSIALALLGLFLVATATLRMDAGEIFRHIVQVVLALNGVTHALIVMKI